MNEWKELEIGNIPSDFFVNERYEIENRWKEGEWLPSDNWNLKDRSIIISNLLNEEFYEYRYRLKPLEPIRITKEALMDIIDILQHKTNHISTHDAVEKYYGRPVEIIE